MWPEFRLQELLRMAKTEGEFSESRTPEQLNMQVVCAQVPLVQMYQALWSSCIANRFLCRAVGFARWIHLEELHQLAEEHGGAYIRWRM